MRILMLNYEYPPLGGGASPVTQELCQSLSKKEVRFDIITMRYKGLPEKEIQGNVIIYRVPCIRRKVEFSNTFEMFTFLISAYFKGTELIKTNKYDFIHAHFIIPTGILAYLFKKQFGLNYMITSHGSDVPGYNPDRFKLGHKLVLPFWKLIARNASYITSPSERLKNLIKKNVSIKNIDAIPNGIVFHKVDNLKKEKIILYAGRLFKRKGVQYLIKAIDGIKNWKLVIAGDGYYRPELETLAKSTDANIEFKGWLPKEELKRLYKKSSIFVLPSSEESFGMVIIEAMMYSNAIIATDVCKEVVSDSGLIVKKECPQEIRKALDHLILNSENLKRYQSKARIRSESFSWDNVSLKFLSLYKKLAK